MGFFKKFFSKLGIGKTQVRVLCVGLDNSGKSTLINWLKPKKASAIEVVPTIGFAIEEFSKNNVQFTVFDMSGQGRYRNLWEHYYDEAQAIIFVVDSVDKLRICVAKNELETLLNHKSIAGTKIPILFFANKMDVPGALSHVEVSRGLELEKINNRPWSIFSSNALTGEGVEEGIMWLCDHLRGKKA